MAQILVEILPHFFVSALAKAARLSQKGREDSTHWCLWARGSQFGRFSDSTFNLLCLIYSAVRYRQRNPAGQHPGFLFFAFVKPQWGYSTKAWLKHRPECSWLGTVECSQIWIQVPGIERLDIWMGGVLWSPPSHSSAIWHISDNMWGEMMKRSNSDAVCPQENEDHKTLCIY